MKDILLFTVTALVMFAFIGCGPMNEKPADTPNIQGEQKDKEGVFEGAQKSKSGLFYVKVIRTKSDVDTQEEAPCVGENPYMLKLVSTSSLSSISEDSKIVIKYWMSAMPGMGISDAEVMRHEDGTYRAHLDFSMSGEWEVKVSIQEGTNRDEYTFKVKP